MSKFTACREPASYTTPRDATISRRRGRGPLSRRCRVRPAISRTRSGSVSPRPARVRPKPKLPSTSVVDHRASSRRPKRADGRKKRLPPRNGARVRPRPPVPLSDSFPGRPVRGRPPGGSSRIELFTSPTGHCWGLTGVHRQARIAEKKRALTPFDVENASFRSVWWVETVTGEPSRCLRRNRTHVLN